MIFFKGTESQQVCDVCQNIRRKIPKLGTHCDCSLECYKSDKITDVEDVEIIQKYMSMNYPPEHEPNYDCNICYTLQRKLKGFEEPMCKCSLERWRGKTESEIEVAGILLDYFSETNSLEQTEGRQVCETCQTQERKTTRMEMSHCICSLKFFEIKMQVIVKKADVMLQYWPKTTSDERVENMNGCQTCWTSRRKIPNMGTFCNCSLEYFIIDNETDSKMAEIILDCWSKNPATESSENTEKCEACAAIFRKFVQLDGSHCMCSLRRYILQKKTNIKMAKEMFEKHWKRPELTPGSHSPKTRFHRSTQVEMDSAIGITYRAEKSGHFYYPMSNKRGYHLIFAHSTFNLETGQSDREGTEVDVHNLQKAFQELGFENQVFKNLTKAEISKKLEDYSKKDHSGHDCIAITMLTHGEVGELWAKDDKFRAESLWTPFEANKCRTLALKPKIIITQACRGAAVSEKFMCPDNSGMKFIVQKIFSFYKTYLQYSMSNTNSEYKCAVCSVRASDLGEICDLSSSFNPSFPTVHL